MLQLYQDPELGQASFTSITDHLLTQSILSFVITGAVQPQLDDDPSNSDLSDEDDINDLVKFDSRKNIAIIRLHCIQTKCVCVCVCVCSSAYVYVCMYVCAWVGGCVYVCTCMCVVQVCVYVNSTRVCLCASVYESDCKYCTCILV